MLPGRDPDRGSDIDPYDSCQSTARAPKARGVKLGGHAENLKIAEFGRRKAAARTADLIPVTSHPGSAEPSREPGVEQGKTGGLAVEKGEQRLESCLPMGSGLPADHPRPAEPI
jgi:hypothetical protein